MTVKSNLNIQHRTNENGSQSIELEIEKYFSNLAYIDLIIPRTSRHSFFEKLTLEVQQNLSP